MIKALVVGTRAGTIELLHRRVGGILKDIARVDTCWFDDVEKTKADMYICYSYGFRIQALKDMFKNTNKKVVGAELTLLPAGVKLLKALPRGCKVGVFSEHLRCANHFLSEIIKSGVVEYHFIAAPMSEMKDVDVDYYIVPEELMDLVAKEDKSRGIIKVPRTITSMSAAEIINVALSE